MLVLRKKKSTTFERFPSWEISKCGVVNAHLVGSVVLVGDKPLQCTGDHRSPDTKVIVRLVSTFFLTTTISSSDGSRDRLVANFLPQVNNMSTITVLALW